MLDERPLEKIPVRDARGVADVLFKNSEPPKEILTPVELPEIKKVEPTITPLERFWAWVNYYAESQIIKGTRGEPVANPFAFASFAANWWKWLVAGIVVLILVLVIGRWF